MRKLFLDTSYMIALNSSSDQNHDAAQANWQLLIADLPSLVTTSYVLDETVTFFNSRNQHTKAVEVGERLIASRHVLGWLIRNAPQSLAAWMRRRIRAPFAAASAACEVET